MSEWKEYYLKDITSKIGSGATPKGGKESYYQEGISLIRSQNILDFEFSNNGLAFIDAEQAEQLKNVVVNQGDILLNITGDSVARVCKVPEAILPARVNQHVSIIRTKQAIADSNFILYFLLNPVFKKKLLQIASDGATRNALTKGHIESLRLKLPSVDEQKRVANVLSCLDAKIDNLRRQNETLEEIARSIFKHWFIDFEFPNADDKPYKSSGGVMVRSDLGDIPECWQVSTIGSEVEIVGGGTPSTTEPSYWENGDIAWYSPTDLTRSKTLFSIDSEKKITKTGLQKSSAKLFPKYSLLLTSRATIGEVTISTKDASTNQGFITIIPNEKFSIHFLHGWLLTKIGIIKLLASGSTFPEISKSSFRGLDFLIPLAEVLEKYDLILNPIYKRVENNIFQIQTLTKTRDALLPKLMSGQLRVNE